MPLEAACLAYGGFAQIARATYRYRDRQQPAWLAGHARWILGGLLLASSLVAAVIRFGPYQGPVAWIGMMSVAAAAVTVMLSFSPGSALRLSWAAVALAILMALA